MLRQVLQVRLSVLHDGPLRLRRGGQASTRVTPHAGRSRPLLLARIMPRRRSRLQCERGQAGEAPKGGDVRNIYYGPGKARRHTEEEIEMLPTPKIHSRLKHKDLRAEVQGVCPHFAAVGAVYHTVDRNKRHKESVWRKNKQKNSTTNHAQRPTNKSIPYEARRTPFSVSHLHAARTPSCNTEPNRKQQNSKTANTKQHCC